MPAPTFRVVGGAYRRRHTQVPPYEHRRTAPFCWGAGTSSDTVRHKAAVPTPHGVVGGGFSVSPEPRTNYRPTRRAGPMCPAAPYRVALTGAWGRMRNRFVGRGILDASMVHSIRGRQGCRPLRSGWSVARTGGGTHRCRPTNIDGLPRFAGGRDGGLAAYAARIAPSADGALDDRGFRPLRRAGVSRRVRRGYFAPCAGRVFRPLRRTTGGAASGLRDLGNAPPVGKRCRRGILCQSKAQVRRHTGCMARSWAAAMAQKARRHPQSHRW